MTTKEKIKILNMPTVQGELIIKTRYGQSKYSFGDLYNYIKRRSSNERNNSCIMIGRLGKSAQDMDDYINPTTTCLKIWRGGYGTGILEQKIKWSDVTISHAIYQGQFTHNRQNTL